MAGREGEEEEEVGNPVNDLESVCSECETDVGNCGDTN